MSASCGNTPAFDGLSSDYKRRLWAVIAINATMFLVELIAGRMAGSHALQADALDFFGDSVTYGVSLAVIGAPLRTRANVALLKGVSLLLMAGWILATTGYSAYLAVSADYGASGVAVGAGPPPESLTMLLVGLVALAANLASVLILVRHKDGDANVRSVWLCSRNDAIGNVAVMLAAVAVWFSASRWPDLIVALAMASLFLSSALQIIRQALGERNQST